MTKKFNIENRTGEVILRPKEGFGEISLSMTYAQLREKYGINAALTIYLNMVLRNIFGPQDNTKTREE
jgi:hypothetical protein